MTLIVYTAYPLIYKIQNRTINLRGYEAATVIMLIVLLGLVNFFYLRRGRLKISVRDWLHIMIWLFKRLGDFNGVSVINVVYI